MKVKVYLKTEEYPLVIDCKGIEINSEHLTLGLTKNELQQGVINDYVAMFTQWDGYHIIED